MTGTWIGVHSESSPNAFCPLPIYLKLDPDSTYHLGMVDGSAAEQISTWALQGERVRLDTIHYAPKLITVQDGLLRIGKIYPMTFRRFHDVPIDSVKAYQHLVGRSWQSDSLAVRLYANGRVALEHPINKRRTIHFWRLARFGNSLFLIIRGNQYMRDGNYKSLWQISGISASQLQTVNWNGQSIAIKTFRWVENLLQKDSCKASAFQPCDNCFQSVSNGLAISRSPRPRELMQVFTKSYHDVCQPGQSGLIRLRFDMNCMGEQGNIDVRGYGEDYCPKTFEGRITNQLLTICRDHIASIALRRDDNNADDQPRDTAVSITFRLKDGQLIDLL